MRYTLAFALLLACSKPAAPPPTPEPAPTPAANPAPAPEPPTPASEPEPTPAPTPEPAPTANSAPSPTPAPTRPSVPRDGMLGRAPTATFARDGEDTLRLTEGGAGWREAPWRFVVHVERKVGDTWQRGIGLTGLTGLSRSPTWLAWGDGIVGLVAFDIDIDAELSGTWLIADGDDRAGVQRAFPQSGQALAQTYALMGDNRGPGRYEGTLTIDADGAPDRYALTWKIGAKRYRGVGLKHGTQLVGCWAQTGTTCGVGLYVATDLAQGPWTGLIADTTDTRIAHETLVRREAASPPAHSVWLGGVIGVALANDGDVRATHCVGDFCEETSTGLRTSAGPLPAPTDEPVPLAPARPCGDAMDSVRAGDLVATTNDSDSAVCLWNAKTGHILHPHELPAVAVGRLLPSPPAPRRYIAIESFAPEDPETTKAERPRFVDVLASPSGRRVARAKGNLPQPMGAFSPDGAMILSLELDGTLHLVPLPHGKPLKAAHRYQIAAFSPHGILIGVTLAGDIEPIDRTTGVATPTSVRVHGRLLTPLVFSADGRSIVFANRAGVHLIDI